MSSTEPAPLTVSVVVPVHNEVESLPAFHDELLASCQEWRFDGRPLEVEIVYVDDGSSDGSLDLLEKYHREHPGWVRAVVLRRNFGKSGALAAGFSEVEGEVIVTMDADGQDVPSEVPKLLDLLAGGYDLVGGWRRRRADRITKRLTSKLYNWGTRALTGLDLNDFNTGMKAMRREVAEELPLYGEFHRFVPVLAHDLGFRVGEVEVTHRERVAGESKYLSWVRFPKTLLDLLTVMFLTRFAERPLYLFGGFGLALSLIGGGSVGYLVVLKIATGAGIGGRPLLNLGILALLMGVLLIGIGFIGDVLRHTMAARETPYRVRRRLR